MNKKRGPPAGIQSIEVGAPLLATLADASSTMTLTALAKAARMSPSKAHKYLASFTRVGLVSQSADTGRYTLGPLAVELGFAALRRLDVVELAQDVLNELRDRLDLTGSLTVWGSHGPTIVRRADNRQPVSLVVRLGLVLPLLTSSNGQIFAAYLDRRITEELMNEELAIPNGPAARAGLRNMGDVEKLLAAVRKNGIAVVEGLVCAGVSSISAPVFAQSGELVASLTVVGVQGMINASRLGKPAQTLVASARSLSARLGRKESTPAPSPPPAAKPEAKSGKRRMKTQAASAAGGIR